MRDFPRIAIFLEGLGLTIHPKKHYEIDVRDGVSFLGAKVYCKHILPGERSLKYMAELVYLIETSGNGKFAGIGSYDGLFAHYDSEKAIRKIFQKVGWEYCNISDRISSL